MKKIILGVATVSLLFACKTQNVTETPTTKPTVANINLVDVENDKVWVTVNPDRFTIDSTSFYIPKTVPGTYSTDNYGKFSENFKALNYKGDEMEFVKIDENSWSIKNAKDLDKVMYQVNDSFDWEGEGGVYSMAGTNILKDKNFLLNLHAFVGYFDKMTEKEFRLEIQRPSELIPGTALTVDQTIEGENSKTDIYNLDRYFEVIDNPIMYSSPDTTSFMVQDMQVLIDVYSPNKKFSAESLKPGMEKMIRAQKKFLGDINSTDKYAILVYLSATPGQNDAGNFGALEHHTSTVVVMPETMEAAALDKSMTDIVSHEFFHIITPLGIHSKEVHYFDYNDPKMSQHLWMYEGVTEYFANLFQVNQGLISNQEFYDRMVDKINVSKRFDDTVPFTVMSKNILTDEYKDSYYNVYQKGALIGMALDIRLRELSGGKTGILDLMKKLNAKYGKDKPFDDDQLISNIVELTYPEIQDFFDTYITGTTPIPYNEFFAKAGIEEKEMMSEVGYFLKGQTPYITANQETMQIIFRDNIELNTFLKDLGVKGGDIVKTINGTEYNIKNVYDLINASNNWKKGDAISMTIIRDGAEMKLEGKVTKPMDKEMKMVEMQTTDGNQMELRNAWLKG
ncbi:peptidase M61 [Christiangramia forsetii]|uniref:Secreted glycyl aminopeptidase, family M61 n=2 Tax=Christiangramia forsetii TaxID=411153 RepID=A0M2T4_CHRFK|nr:peptidase M61 [Christiangramia forsetii]GGG44571.1 peptidase M61 [Christiangramia forsetii]CAL66929.1 secreted glycyl aminopeptidase, family M61 [Christiangramia forsetii KT0803]